MAYHYPNKDATQFWSKVTLQEIIDMHLNEFIQELKNKKKN